MINLKIPTSNSYIENLNPGNQLLISGTIYTGRDAVLPKIANLIDEGRENEIPFDLEGIAIMHTAVSDAGIATTTSNKEEIESSIPILSKAGVKVHIGKGSLSHDTIAKLNKENSIFVISPPVAALLTNCVKSKEIVMFEEEGIEAIFKLKVVDIPGIVAIANGRSIFY
ncbi:MAG: fumarate hydratase C-terminal domain-containing protein [Methanobrevibacter sp.]|jgi:fumarate hydratase subunit beta|nr:fumarate hydratase C-terminal domain-containing protein [Methanobrevibacter sp.]